MSGANPCAIQDPNNPHRSAAVRATGATNSLDVAIVDSAGNQINTFGGSGGTAQADKSTFTEGTTNITPVGGVFNEVIAADPTEDQAACARITPKRAIHVNLRDNAGAEVSVGGGTQFDEGTAHVSGDKLTLAGVVQQTADTALSADGSRSLLQVDASGFLKVNIKAGSGGGVTHVDDAPFAPATDDGVPIFGFFDDVTPDSVDEGDAGAVRMSGNRNLYMRIRDNAGNERGANVTAANELNVLASAQPGVDIGDLTVNNAAGASAVNIQDGGNSITVDGTVSVSGTVTVDSELPAAIALADNASNPTAPAVGAFGMVWDGAGWDRLTGTSADGALVNLGTNNDVIGAKANNGGVPGSTNLGVLAAVAGAGAPTYTEGNQACLSTDLSGNLRTTVNGVVQVVGDDAHDAPVVGDPVLIGGRASAAAPADVSADGDAVRAWRLRNGAAAVVVTAAGALIGGDAANGLDVDVTRLPSIPAGTNNIGDVDVLSIAAGDNNIGNVDVVTLPPLVAGTANIGDVDVLTLPPLVAGTALIGRVNPEPQTSGGLSISRTLSAASTNATSVKASAGQVYTIYAHNSNAAIRFLKLYNKASAPTVGTDTPVMTLPIPGNTAGAGFVFDTGGMGVAFATGIALALTTGVADSDTGAVAANEIVINLLYK